MAGLSTSTHQVRKSSTNAATFFVIQVNLNKLLYLEKCNVHRLILEQLWHDRSTGHLFLRRPVLWQGAAGAGDRQLRHQRVERRRLRGVAGEHAEQDQWR